MGVARFGMDALFSFAFSSDLIMDFSQPQCTSIATSLNNLAELSRLQDNYEQAELIYKRALVYLEQTLGPEHPYIATILENLTILYCDQGKYNKAEPLYQRAMLLYKQTSGLEYAGTTTVLGNYVDLLQNLNRDGDHVLVEY